jgi:hypothetical protein
MGRRARDENGVSLFFFDEFLLGESRGILARRCDLTLPAVLYAVSVSFPFTNLLASFLCFTANSAS